MFAISFAILFATSFLLNLSEPLGIAYPMLLHKAGYFGEGFEEQKNSYPREDNAAAKDRGVLIFYRQKKPFVSDEIALGEYAATLFCIAMWKKEEESARGMRNQYDKVDQEMDERR